MSSIKMKCPCGAEFDWPINDETTNTAPNDPSAVKHADAWIERHKNCVAYHGFGVIHNDRHGEDVKIIDGPDGKPCTLVTFKPISQEEPNGIFRKRRATVSYDGKIPLKIEMRCACGRLNCVEL